MSKLFEERIPYKPFEYPEYYTEGWLKQAQSFWLHTEIAMQGDVKDWKENLTDSEKNLVGNILLGFAQTECAVSDYWTTMVTRWFPKHEIKQMAMMFGSQETIHATAIPAPIANDGQCIRIVSLDECVSVFGEDSNDLS